MRTAAIVLIGNELLSGKIRDENASWLTGRLRALGVQLRRVVMIPDEPEIIVDELRRLAPTVDDVFTSGGVGPTHDDLTIESVAAAFGVSIVREPRLEAILRAHFGERLRPDHLRMADVPEGTELIEGGDIRWPVVHFRNLWILPGVPQIFRAKFDAIASRFRDGAFFLRSVYLDADEGAVAPVLRDLQARFGVEVGSYPRIDEADHRVRVTIEARAAAPVDAAAAALLAALPVEQVVRADDAARPAG
jgi:molybdenum cofactor synthesis domain-containing protein